MTVTELSVVTYNIHKGFSSLNRRFVLPKMRSALADSGADIVFLQEALGEHQRHASRHPGWPEDPQFEFIADTIWPHFAYGKNAIYDDGHHGNAILSRYPFDSWENITDFPYPFQASRSLLHGSLVVPGAAQRLHVVCVHFGFLGRERRAQVRLLTERIAAHVPADEPLIVAGDFNDWSGRAVSQSRLGLTEAFRSLNGNHARTFPAWAPLLPMDRIYCRGLEPIAAERLKGSPWSMLSDHNPLQAWFRL
jgi:endonuclease/exonuclease/phosphatase family metal-dependent hydrolase